MTAKDGTEAVTRGAAAELGGRGRTRARVFAVDIAASLCVVIAPVDAQEMRGATEVSASSSYPADFFSVFRPQTALDMLSYTPGFTLIEGDMLRGFGGTAGNVLIDGQRPAVKSGGISEVLTRLPASRVERVELLLGGTAAEARGQMVVANIVSRTATDEAAGTVSAELARTFDERFGSNASLSYARPIGRWDSTFEVVAELERFPSESVYRVSDRGDAVVASRRERIAGQAPDFSLAGTLNGLAGGGTLALNGRLAMDGFRSQGNTSVYAGDLSAPLDSIRETDYDERTTGSELSADWRRDIGNGWTAKLLSLGQFAKYESDDDYLERAADSATGGTGYRGISAFGQRSVEAVARAAFARTTESKLTPELGVELAYNRVANRLRFTRDVGAGPEPVALIGSHARVAEIRAEPFVNGNIALTSKLNAEVGAAVELSKIEVTGDASNSQRLTYFKPFASLLWSLNERLQLKADLRRTVDQLDFTDFAASVDQIDNREFGGNAELKPQRVTQALLRAEYRWSAKGAISAELFSRRYSGLIGYLLLPSGDEALGAIGNGMINGVTTRLTLPLERVLPGAQLVIDGTVYDSHVVDPITGIGRGIDEWGDKEIEAEFRHNLPGRRFSWGIGYEAPIDYRIFYVTEALEERQKALWSAYFETVTARGLKTTVSFDAVNGNDNVRRRRFFSGSRAGELAGREYREMRQGSSLSVELSLPL